MAGSRKWMVYSTDDDVRYAVQIDESNGEACDFADYTPAFDTEGEQLPVLPKGFQMRYINTSTNANDGGSRRLWVGNRLSGLISGAIAFVLLPYFSANTAQAVAYAVSSVIGEKSGLRPKSQDTGILDGDAT